MFKRLSLIVLLVVTTMQAGCTNGPIEKNSLKLGAIPLIINLPGYVAQQEGLFEEQGLEVEIVPLTSTAVQMSAFQSGDVDGIFQHIYATAILNKDGETGKLVGASVMPVFNIVASGGSGIISVEDLKHQEIAVATNTVIDYALERLLLAEGLDIDDIVKVNVSNMPLRLEMLNQGMVPAAILSSPLSDLAVLSGGRVIVNDLEQPFAGPGLVFTRGALKDKSDAIGRFIQVWQQAVELINTEPEKYHGLLSEISRAPETISQSLKVPTFPKLELPTQAEVESVVDWMVDKGITDNRLAYEEIMETKYLR